MIHFTKKQFLYSSVYLALFIYPFSSIEVYAEQATELSDVQVVGKKKKANRKDNEVTGLGKIVKNSDSINREQVLNIRDLVRYDPGIAIVEQGRGGSAGYSIRGVDKNRVAVVVDGIPQAQSYVMQGEHRRARHGGGSINEVENENIASVEISKGASSSEYGSGSLGGAIGFRTKEPSDIIPEGKNWGITAKSAYSSKNEQYTNSIALAGQKNGFEALIQYTDKKGKSTKIHKDAINTINYEIGRLGYHFNESEGSDGYGSWFILKNDCPNDWSACAPQPEVKTTKDDLIVEKIKAEDYTGNERVIPDPMRYKTGSLLTKLGYHFDEKNYLGFVYEETKQRYDIRDMTTKAYYDLSEIKDFERGVHKYSKNGNPLDGLYIQLNESLNREQENSNDDFKKGIGLRWARAQFFDENHKKLRTGLVYRFKGNDNSWIDNLDLSWDNQKIILDSQIHNSHCSEYPSVNKNCRPTIDKPYSFYGSERNTYSEQHHLIKLSLDKKFELYKTKHHINSTIGFDLFKSNLDRSDYYNQFSAIKFLSIPINERPDASKVLGTKTNPYRDHFVSKVITEQLCNDNLSAFRDCNTRTIKGNNRFVSLNDQININKYVDFGLGIRLDEYKFRSQDPWVSVKNYRTTSWNMGVVVKPIKNIALSYRVSTGFRVPSFQELFGYRVPGIIRGEADYIYKASDLKPEKSLNNELGVSFKGNFGALEISYFRNKYNDLITVARKEVTEKHRIVFPQYHNSQSMEIEGINIVGKLDWNSIYDKLPEGLFSTLAYNRVKPTKVSYNSGLTDVSTYAFDALQPARYILGLGYEHPENKWGINSTLTYSKAKNPNELVQVIHNSSGTVNTVSNTKRTTRSWYTIDVVGHITLFKNATLRAGVYNLMNYRYLTWESIRQSTEGSINQHHDVNNYARYAAPGRNFVLSLEAKF
ncbi:hemoglobin/transferrin/lactoferrin receptor protein [Bisgaardia hudsonensis]|uniref:Hemoglobin/transferrin/lactoferrin receptor protein n=1 Tax=Bisgaardia hudsonensis TaxID=109472 RepID=A0A4R2MWM2_9PAST|nr:lactoferrin/transferrin family TonB-dependent receptor [Bisgaardia hudsonensis]QLB12119.1 hypothetical protein A6A11_00080 [Bisgaardia hudsonensis]TCP11477.1 hemoglobin/transferrin/lactoferrin receptor protein [Bisgaardia hudsonensis]